MWKTSSYAIMGRGHERTDTPCQDKTHALSKNSVTVIALADGAGSATLSHFGAETATKTISEHLAENFDSIIANQDGLAVKQELMEVLTTTLAQEAENRNCILGDLASTLLVAAVKGDAFLLIHLGDGVIAMQRNQELKLASGPANGEFANSTFFVTSKNALKHLRLFKGSTHGLNGFVLMSDGTAESFYQRKQEKLSQGIKKLMDLSLLLTAEKFDAVLDVNFREVIRKNTTDDCSMAIIANTSQSKAIYQHLAAAAKCDLFRIQSRNPVTMEKRLKKLERILKTIAQEPKSLEQLTKELHIRKKYLKRDLTTLAEQGVISKTKGCYHNLLPL